MNEVFNMSVDKVFELLFTDSKFFRDFVGTNKTFGKLESLCCRVLAIRNFYILDMHILENISV